MTTKDHIDAISDGLPLEYDVFMHTMSVKTEEISVEEIEALLLAREARIEKNRRFNDGIPNLANVAMTGNPRSSGPRFSSSSSSGVFNASHFGSSSSRPSTFHYPCSSQGNSHAFGGFQNNSSSLGNFSHKRGYKGKEFSAGSYGFNPFGKKPFCQICFRPGHVALQCYCRFDRSFTGPSQIQNQHLLQGNIAHLYCPESSQLAAMVATPESIS